MTAYLQRRRGFSASSIEERHHWSAIAEKEGCFAPALTVKLPATNPSIIKPKDHVKRQADILLFLVSRCS